MVRCLRRSPRHPCAYCRPPNSPGKSGQHLVRTSGTTLRSHVSSPSLRSLRAGRTALADALEPGTALAFLLVEHYWAAPLFDAIAETGGTLIGEGFLTAETGLVVGAEVAAMEEASEMIAQAQAIEADALLTAAAARAEAAEAVAEPEQIQSAAAVGAVRALIAAGLVEEAAAHEAVTALTTAGLIVAAADQAAAAAVAEDAATVAAADEVTAAS